MARTRLAARAAAQVLRELGVQSGATGAVARRLEQTVNFLNEQPARNEEFPLGELVDQLFPDAVDRLAGFRGFRARVAELAASAGVDFAIEVDSAKRTAPGQRSVWFAGVAPLVETYDRLSRDLVRDRPRVFVDAYGSRPHRVCFDLDPDSPYATHVFRVLGQRLETLAGVQIEVTATLPRVGDDIEESARRRIQEADVLVVLVTRSLLGRRATLDPADVPETVVAVPLEVLDGVELGPFSGAHSAPAGTDPILEGSRASERFEAIAEDILSAITHRGGPLPPESDSQDISRSLLAVIENAIPPGMTDLVKGPFRTGTMDLGPQQRRLHREQIDVQSHLAAWSSGKTSTRPYLVLFGDYGMGKTTACEEFTRRNRDARNNGEDLPVVVYIDLRLLGELDVARVSIGEILDEWLRRSWRSGTLDKELDGRDVLELVRAYGATLVFDGLDEVLVHLTPRQGQRFVRELWRALPPSLLRDKVRAPNPGRLVFSCRTHYFRTLHDQLNFFRGEDRDDVGASLYETLHLLPFGVDQVAEFLAQRDPASGFGNRSSESALDSVHGLRDLVQRPVLLRMIADQLPELDLALLGDGPLSPSDLYEGYCDSWLRRDAGKHQVPPDLKLGLMEDLALHFWREGVRQVDVAKLEFWLQRHFVENDQLRNWFQLAQPDLEVIFEDLRTSAFLVRDDNREFGFAHASMLEFFVARRLTRAIDDLDPDPWTALSFNNEIFDFVGGILDRGPGARVNALRSLSASSGSNAARNILLYTVRALEMNYLRPSLEGTEYRGLDLTGLEICGTAAASLDLTDCDFEGADLGGSVIENVRLDRSSFDRASLVGVSIARSTMRSVTFVGADLWGLTVVGCDCTEAKVADSRPERTKWIDCLPPPDVAGDDRHLVAPGVNRSPESFELCTTAIPTGVTSVAWVDGGSRFAVAVEDSVFLIDRITGEVVQEIGVAAPIRALESAATAPESVVVVLDDGIATVDFGTGEVEHLYTDVGGSLVDGSLSLSGSSIAAVGARHVVLVELESRSCRRIEARGTHCVGLSPDTTLIALGGGSGLQVVRASDGLVVHRQPTRRRVTNLEWSPDGLKLAFSAGPTLEILDAGSWEIQRTTTADEDWSSMSWSPDGRRLVAATVIRVSIIGTLPEIERHFFGRGNVEVAWSPDSRCIVWTDKSAGCQLLEPGGEPKRNYTSESSGTWTRAKLSPDGSRLAAVSSARLTIWDTESAEILAAVDDVDQGSWVAWHPEGNELAICGMSGLVVVDSRESGSVLARRITREELARVEWQTGTGHLVTSGQQGVRVLDPATGTTIARPGGKDWHPATTLAPCPNSGWIAYSDAKGLRLWDGVAGTRPERFPLPATALGIAWSGDGAKLLVVGGEDLSASDRGREQLGRVLRASRESAHTVNAAVRGFARLPTERRPTDVPPVHFTVRDPDSHADGVGVVHIGPTGRALSYLASTAGVAWTAWVLRDDAIAVFDSNRTLLWCTARAEASLGWRSRDGFDRAGPLLARAFGDLPVRAMSPMMAPS